MLNADYFGHKIYLDQNEKLKIFEVTYRHFTMTCRLWDQVCVDGGQEFNLVCHIQEYLRNQRKNLTIDPFKSTKSTENNVI